MKKIVLLFCSIIILMPASAMQIDNIEPLVLNSTDFKTAPVDCANFVYDEGKKQLNQQYDIFIDRIYSIQKKGVGESQIEFSKIFDNKSFNLKTYYEIMTDKYFSN